MKRRVLLMAVMCLAVTGAHATDLFVAVPETTWADLLPYLEANIRVEIKDGTLSVGTSGAAYERKLVNPYDPALGEFATVFLGQSVLNDRRVRKAIKSATHSIKDSGVDIPALPRNELIATYWQVLTAEDQFIGRLQELFIKAQSKGRLKCIICGEGFKPQYLEVQ